MGSKKVVLTDTDIEAARARGKQIAEAPSAIEEVHATRLEIPVSAISELAKATDQQLSTIVVSPLRDAISISALDVDIYVPGLISDVLDSNAARNFARLGGSRQEDHLGKDLSMN